MEKGKREWKGAQRLVNGRFKTGSPARDRRSAEHHTACSTGRVLRYLPWPGCRCRTTGLQGKPGHPGSSAIRLPPRAHLGRLCKPGKVLGSVIPLLLTPTSVAQQARRAVSKPGQAGRSDAQSWRCVRREDETHPVSSQHGTLTATVTDRAERKAFGRRTTRVASESGCMVWPPREAMRHSFIACICTSL
jgi:hypothetical protein